MTLPRLRHSQASLLTSATAPHCRAGLRLCLVCEALVRCLGQTRPVVSSVWLGFLVVRRSDLSHRLPGRKPSLGSKKSKK
ncbi:unnamed protein product [Protopolystoma xenopodis]|uniref:Uncharacterized protein n=1 Tax=Protopolystoma xenopodis TaxID=117903 RepID=A0A3S5AP44_9PLAT|nr:unnamed protein product [Protopolystoma xenopodis]